jgi:hypothetical protein
VRIRVRIDPPHPLVCRKRRLNGAVLRMRPKKTEAPCHSRCGTIKIPPCSKALRAEHRPKFFTYMETSPLPVKGCKFRPMIGAQDLWAMRDLYRATPAMTRDLGFSGLIRRTAPLSRLLRHTKGCGRSILTLILTGLFHSVLKQKSTQRLNWGVCKSSTLGLKPKVEVDFYRVFF